ncbi:MAG: 1-(5-phosphoribosyl)-5-[(5-phosphoribosylamino)methylideneamino]imidazole-4-carboxamide isomerase [Planctomycetota bacterium]|nr:1-(5-phosphoribosyl)-5-[(5-phosphoribosylamino)methylideneamino]imidazole-4-carboxamide isomerase [Planctomycetota bacterium]
MIVYPAIDLRNHRCVRLEQGDFDAATIYNDDPIEQAFQWKSAGSEFLHIVDLDGALTGYPTHAKMIHSIVESTEMKVQVGGGIREEATVAAYIESGANRVVLGTLITENPELALRIAKNFPGKIVAGLDFRNNRVAIRGWKETTSESPLELAHRLSGEGFVAIVATDIQRDGVLIGPNINFYSHLLSEDTGLEIVASGGVASIEDLLSLQNSGCHGAIIGRALYTGSIDLSQALAALSNRA